MRMRTLNEAHASVIAQDPETGLTKTALRRMVVSGVIPSVRVGNKYLIDLDLLETHLSGASAKRDAQSVYGAIRPVEV